MHVTPREAAIGRGAEIADRAADECLGTVPRKASRRAADNDDQLRDSVEHDVRTPGQHEREVDRPER